MKTLTYVQAHHLGKLHAELLAAIPSLRPVPSEDGPPGAPQSYEAVMSISGDGTTLTLSVPDDEPEPPIAAVVAAHDPTPPPPPIVKSAIQEVKVEDHRTTNATISTLASWPLAVQTLYTARFTLTAIDTVNADCRVWTAKATAKRVNGGALLVGTPVLETSHADAGAAAWAVAADVSGNNFRVRVTGANGRTISWSLLGEFIRARPDGLVD